jgi:serine/threonine-protein kinase
MDSPLPQRVGRYDVLARIASGGMATVYLARAHGALGFERDVALKLTHAHLRESPEFSAVLLEEAKLAVRIRHSNVVPVLDVGEDPQGIFLVMEYVEGDTLAGLTRKATAAQTPLPLGVSMRVLLDALAGLHATHEQRDEGGAPLDIVHRDFSPANILVGTDGVGKLTDFGIAKAQSRVGHTATGMVKGKVSYMAPEQARGQKVDRRADVWAAGVVAWEVLAGRRLHAEVDGIATLLKVVSEAPPRLRSVRPEIHAALDDAVAGALTLDATERCPSAQAFARELTAALLSAGERVAEADEVAAHVRALVGRKLSERRARARGVREAIAEGDGADSAETRPLLAAAAPAEVTRVEPTATETTAAADTKTADVGNRPRRLPALLAAGAGACFVFLVAAGVWTAQRSSASDVAHASPEDSASAAPPPSPASSPALSPPPSPPPSAPPASTSAATRSPTPAPPPTPTPTPPRRAQPRATPPPAPAPPRPAAPSPLAPSPYSGP